MFREHEANLRWHEMLNAKNGTLNYAKKCRWEGAKKKTERNSATETKLRDCDMWWKFRYRFAFFSKQRNSNDRVISATNLLSRAFQCHAEIPMPLTWSLRDVKFWNIWRRFYMYTWRDLRNGQENIFFYLIWHQWWCHNLLSHANKKKKKSVPERILEIPTTKLKKLEK